MGKQAKPVTATYKVTLSNNALQNIDDITHYIAFVKLQPLNAIKVGDALFAAVDLIAVNPRAFKECELLPTKTKIYRQAVCLSWLIIYKIRGFEITVLGIIHGSRKPSKLRALRKVK
jgi:plasmid stabilization system protein ParE